MLGAAFMTSRLAKGCDGRLKEQGLGVEFAVDQAHEQGGQDDPGELVPIEKGKAPERGGRPGVELWEAEAKVGQQEQQRPASEALFRLGGELVHGALSIPHPQRSVMSSGTVELCRTRRP